MTRNDTNREQSITDEPILCVRGLGKDYTERRPFTGTRNTVCAFDEIDLTVRRGTTLAIVGESGAGKSTLARCMALFEKPTRGQIWLEGRNIESLPERALKTFRTKVQMIFQDPASAMNPAMTAEQIVAEPLVIQWLGTKADRRERVIGLLEQVGIPAESMDKRSPEFSGGQKQRLVIARALALNPKLLVLDEPCSGLDLKTQELILGLLHQLQTSRGMSFIYISHDLRTVADFANEIAVMYRGRIVEHNSAAELVGNPLHSYTQELLCAMPSIEALCENRLVGALR